MDKNIRLYIPIILFTYNVILKGNSSLISIKFINLTVFYMTYNYLPINLHFSLSPNFTNGHLCAHTYIITYTVKMKLKTKEFKVIFLT